MNSSLNAIATPFIPSFLKSNDIDERNETKHIDKNSKKQKKYKRRKQPKSERNNNLTKPKPKHKQVKNKKNKHSQNDSKQRRQDIDFPPLFSSQAKKNKDLNHKKNHRKESNTIPSNDWSNISSNIFQQALDLNDHTQTNENDSDQSITTSNLVKLTKLKYKPFQQNTNIPNQQIPKTETISTDNNTNISTNKQSTSSNKTSKTDSSKLIHVSSKRDITRLRDRWWNIIRQQAIEKQKKSSIMISRKSSSSSLSSYSSSSSSSSSSFLSLVLNEDSTSYSKGNIPSFITQSSDQNLAFHKYNQQQYPLHAAICDNQYSAIQYMLTNPDKYQSSYFDNPSIQSLSISKSQLSHIHSTQLLHSKQVSPLQLAICLDKPNILKLLLDSNIYSFQQNINTYNNNDIEPSSMCLLIIAVQLAYDGCVKVLITHGIKMNTKTKDTNDTIFHICCEYAQPTTFQLLWNAFGKGSTKTRTLLCSRNKNGQTPLHIACFTNHITMVQELLTSCSVAATKAYHMEDNDGYTPLAVAINVNALDVVAYLLNWNTNHNQKQKMIFQNKQSSQCNVLNIAVKNGSLDMLSLLMEWNDDLCLLSNISSSSSSIFHDALIHAMEYTTNTTIRLEMIKLLIENGSNPYHTSNLEKSHVNISCNDIPYSPFCLAAKSGDIPALQVMMDTFDTKLKNEQKIRRNNTQLQRQPKSFFDKKDQKETNLVDASIRDALVISLYHAWMDDQIHQQEYDLFSNHLKSAIFLLKRNAILDDTRLMRLITSMSRFSKGMESFYPTGNALFKGHYIHCSPLLIKKPKDSSSPLNAMSYWSSVLLNLKWCWDDEYIFESVPCIWMRESFRKQNNDSFSFKCDECYLIVENKPLLAHKSILSLKSQKLAAAIRFATLQGWENNENSHDSQKAVAIPLDLSLKMTSFFIQHCYHGSIIHGLSLDNTICCHELLELAYIAEEYLCPSLSLEVEMRMLSSKPRGCHCWCCCDRIERLSHHTISSQMADASLDHFESIQYFRCHYYVKSPSTLIHANTVIDTLSLHQQHESLIPSDNYSIHAYYSFEPNNSTLKENKSNTCNHEFVYTNPFMAVKATSMKTILQEFKFCLKSDRYLECLHDAMKHIPKDKQHKSRQHYEECFSLSILQNILEDILSCSLPNLSRDKKLHSSSLICPPD